MILSRRSFIAGGAALAALPCRLEAQTAEDGFVVLTARAAEGRLMEADRPATKLESLSGQWPPPLLTAKQGEEFKVRFVNMLDRPMALHWYGVRGPSEMMSISVVPGEDNAFDCVFTPPDAGTFWLSPVADVSRQREMGLYALLEVAEKEPLPAFSDLPLTFDDWRLTDDGQIDAATFGNLEDAIGQGRLGNWFTVNGAYRPKIDIPQGLVRLRILNAANIRTMSILIKGADPLIIAEDGQPVPPRQLGTAGLVLAPGQRGDLLLAESEETLTLAVNLFEDVIEAAYLTRTGAAAEIVLPDNFALPPNPVTIAIDMTKARTVPFVIEGGEKGGMTGAIYAGEKLDLRALLEKGMAWAINGTAGLAAEPWESFTLGETVILDVNNRTKFDQPLHIHGHVWRVIEDLPTPFRDTVVVPAGAQVKLGFVADNPGRWGIQSTVAERADAGLLTSFEVGA
ncbi:multicopper oxidase family protein [Aestuariivirga sp. YIM B02566]|uniref:Multicopper oxidase family protein n=1 Tax=Taklimakanibacter albus TaxID=2800327 RepID=A0ACC5QZX9_9HYPH|nr:multicopper oxidase family protein [Aestuariivirga sp. YIM B02566]MBK1865954.1 multicopper oxidase family protein [Aestuariivirga sp. YIM B02566]